MMTSFNHQQYHGAYPPGIERHFWVAARNAIIYDTLVAAGMADGKLLDIGCGRGIVVDYLRRRGVDCHGSELGAPNLPDDLSPYVTTGVDAVALPAPLRESISGILLLDVIEHVDDAPAFLRRLASAFPNAKRVFITVPAHPQLWSDWDAQYGHYRRYTPQTLRETVLAAGLHPARLHGFFHSLYAPMRLLSLLGMQRRAEHAPPANPALHGAIARFFRWEARVLPGWLPATSLGLVAHVSVAAALAGPAPVAPLAAMGP